MSHDGSYWAQKLRRLIVSDLRRLGYARGKWSGFVLRPYESVVHFVDVHFSRREHIPFVEVQFCVSSLTLMRLVGFCHYVEKEDFSAHLIWRLGSLMGLEGNEPVPYPESEEVYSEQARKIPVALHEGHRRSISIRSIQELFLRMNAEPSACAVHPLMREFLEGRHDGSLPEIGFEEWRDTRARL